MAITFEKPKVRATEQDNLLERLRAGKSVLLNKVRQEGAELGLRSSSKLACKDFHHFERVRPLADSLDEDALDYLWAFLDLKDYPKQARTLDPDFAHLLQVDPQCRILFVHSWLQGVLSIWQTIKTQVQLQ